VNSDPKFAWHEISRANLQKRSVAERLADFLEIYGPYDEQTAREQASRCILCPDPVCVHACPLDNRIPEWLALTAEGQFSEAAAVLHSTSGMSEITSHLCPADRNCEAVCILNGKAEPVSIWAIEQFLDQYAFSHGEAEGPAAPANGLNVAVIGAGPGGLTCAEVLSRRGFTVTVFDWRLVPGGLLVSGTPAFRLERSIVERRIEMLRKRGVQFRLGVNLGRDFTYAELRSGFDALFLGFGARKPRELDLPGRELRGVTQALAFLVQEHAESAECEAEVDVAGQRVVVIGGGNMALDCVRSAIRSGARETVCVYRRDEESMTSSHGEFDNAVEEGTQFVFQASPVAILGNDRGEVTGLRLVRTSLGQPDAAGRKPYSVQPGTEFEIPANRVFLALGFESVPLPDEPPFNLFLRNPNGGITVDENQMTNVPGVFAGGDLVRGPSTVLNVVRDARRAAQGIEDYLASRLKEVKR
jgi:glutamate synthase (NADPH/NADH) small chain